MGSKLPDQELKPCLLHWKCRVLTTGPPGKSLSCVCVCVLSHFSCVQLFVIQWTVACQAPLSMGFPRQEYWTGLPCLPSGDLSNPGMELMSLISPALAGRFLTTSATWDAHCVPCGILFSQPGVEPAPSALELLSLNHWTTREVPQSVLAFNLFCCSVLTSLSHHKIEEN